MKKVMLVVGTGLVLLTGWRLYAALTATSLPGGTPKVSVEKLNELVTLRVRIGTTLTGENNWYKGIWVIEGQALFGTDCNRAEWTALDQGRKTFTLRLPKPRILVTRVDHDRTRTHDFRSVSWNPVQLIWGNPDAMRDEAMKQAQDKLAREADSEEYFSQARQQAEYNLSTFYKVLGWSPSIEWQ